MVVREAAVHLAEELDVTRAPSACVDAPAPPGPPVAVAGVDDDLGSARASGPTFSTTSSW